VGSDVTLIVFGKKMGLGLFRNRVWFSKSKCQINAKIQNQKSHFLNFGFILTFELWYLTFLRYGILQIRFYLHFG
jgi:hypothetical protein